MVEATVQSPEIQRPKYKSPARWQPTNGLMVGMAVALFAVVGDALIAIYELFFRSLVLDSPILLVAFGIWQTAQLALLSIWVGLGGGKLWVRLLICAAAVALAMLATNEGNWRMGEYVGFALLVALGALPFGAMYLAGYHVESDEEYLAGYRDDEPLRRGQISLRQLFGWTVAATLVAGLARFMPEMPRSAITVAVLSAVLAVTDTAMVFSIFAPRRLQAVAVLLILVTAVTTAMILGASMLLSAGRVGGGEALIATYMSAAHIGLTSGVLLLFRRLGYRLQRRFVAAAART